MPNLDHKRSSGADFPTLVSPPDTGADLEAWLSDETNAQRITSLVAACGAVLLRGFELDGAVSLAGVTRRVAGEPAAYTDRATKRTHLGGNVYTATDASPQASIFLHNEAAFAKALPTRILFHCQEPAKEGGATPIADVQRVFERIDASTRDAFRSRGVLYKRCYGSGFGLDWREAFGTERPERVRELCMEADLEIDWHASGTLETRAHRPAVAAHPHRGVPVWLNHVATLHPSTLEQSKRRMLAKLVGPDRMPYDVLFGDGEPILDETVAQIRAAYLAETVLIEWRRGDTLILDNLAVAHGREPYKGRRLHLATLAGLVEWSAIAAP